MKVQKLETMLCSKMDYESCYDGYRHFQVKQCRVVETEK
jgi:hypothetical protein